MNKRGQLAIGVIGALLTVFVFFCLIFGIPGTQMFRNNWYHFASATSGLNRTVILYANNGSIIKKWSGNINVEDEGSIVSWVDSDGKQVKIEGTVLIEQN